MESMRYKICPGCGKRNAPSRFECRYCETDLTGVRITDESALFTEPDVKQPEMPVESVSGTLVRVCECGAENPSQARKCRICGEDISDILPTASTASQKKKLGYELHSVDSSFSVSIDKPVLIVGRECELKDYLMTKPFVSRRHAKLTILAEKVFIENLSKRNHTFVNNEMISDNESKELHSGDEIGLGGKTIDGVRQQDAAYLVFSLPE